VLKDVYCSSRPLVGTFVIMVTVSLDIMKLEAMFQLLHQFVGSVLHEHRIKYSVLGDMHMVF